jgi:hypothetical protein
VKRVIAIIAALILLPMAAAADCKKDGPGTPSYNARHHIDPSQHAMPNPDPRPERRKLGRPPTGKSVTFWVTADKSMGSLIVTSKVGDGEYQTRHVTGHDAWGTFATVGTPVSLLAAPDEKPKADGTFKHGRITIRITREPASQAEGGAIICQDDNAASLTGGAECAGTV